jgi:hypothetical protein
MFGSGFIEMLARQMTADLQAIRDSLLPGESAALVTKTVSFEAISRTPSGAWDVSLVEGLPPQSLRSCDRWRAGHLRDHRTVGGDPRVCALPENPQIAHNPDS